MRRSILPVLATILLCAVSAPAAGAAPELPRRASLGLKLSPIPGGGAKVDEVFPGQTGAMLGARAGDVVRAAGGKPIASPGDVVRYASSLSAGDRVDLELDRAGKTVRLHGKALGRPKESYAGAATFYGTVPFRGGLLRDILVTPEGAKEPPVLFLIQGYTCASMEALDPSDPYRQIGSALVKAVYAFYRVEKPRSGDSRGGPDCATSDYATELDAFRTAYRHLTDDLGFPADRIFLFGHSMGGLQAPMLAAERSPRGVGAYGTVARNWADYMHDIDSFQAFLMEGADPVKELSRAEANREMLRLFFFEKKSPAEIAAAHPDWKPAMKQLLGTDGGEMAIGNRHYRFLQDLAGLPLVKSWAESKSNVLAMYGQSDIVALFDTDHRLIADIANYYRPGTGRYVEIAGTEHGMTRVGDRAAFRLANMAGQPARPEFNPEIASVLVDWIRSSMASPPVRTVEYKPLAAAAAG